MSYEQEHSYNNSSAEIQRNPNSVLSQIKRGYKSAVDYIKERTSENGVRIVGTAAGIALATAALSGCATGEAPEKTPTSTSAPVETEEPTETPAPTETAPVINAESYKFGISQAEADRLFGIDSVTYETVPIEERAQYVLFQADQSEFVENAESYASFTYNLNGTTFDQLAPEPSVDNTPQEIVAFVTALDRLTFSVPDAEDPTKFDQDVAFRIIASQAVTGKTSPHAGKLVENLSQLVDYDDGKVLNNDALEINSLLATPEVTDASEVTTNEQGRPSIDITYTSNQGNSTTETYQWVTVGGKGVWLPN